MINRFGQRIVTVHPGIDPSLQDALLSAIESVLEGADVERLRIDPSPERDLQVCGHLPASDESVHSDRSDRSVGSAGSAAMVE